MGVVILVHGHGLSITTAATRTPPPSTLVGLSPCPPTRSSPQGALQSLTVLLDSCAFVGQGRSAEAEAAWGQPGGGGHGQRQCVCFLSLLLTWPEKQGGRELEKPKKPRA
jgi:hypothetical protein